MRILPGWSAAAELTRGSRGIPAGEAKGTRERLMVAAAPVTQPGLAAVLKILPAVDIAILGLGALAFSLISYADRERSAAWATTLSRREEKALAAGHGLLGLLLLASSILIENALVIRLTARGEGVAPVSISILVAYLGFSSLALALAAWRSRPAPLLARYHPFLSAVATGALLLLALLAPAAARKSIVPFLPAGFAIASAFLAVRQHRGLQALEGPGGRGEVAGGGSTRIARGEPVPDAPAPPGFPGELLNRFSEPEVIGSGGVSRVFRARRKDTGRIVAVKVPLAMDEVTGMAFLKEMRTWEDLRHENIAKILGANILPTPYVEMEYLPRSLEDLEKPTDIRTAARIIAGIARGLAFAHARGIVHRDLKPGNILLTETMEPRIADWGLSRFLGGATATDISGFSPRYAAPEQIDPSRYGRADRRTDIYGAGGIFYELVTGRPPFTGEGIAEITGRILSTNPVLPSALNPAARPADPVIMRCLEKEPGRRYQTAEDLGKAIDGIIGEENRE
jgi:hypothetical protein